MIVCMWSMKGAGAGAGGTQGTGRVPRVSCTLILMAIIVNIWSVHCEVADFILRQVELARRKAELDLVTT